MPQRGQAAIISPVLFLYMIVFKKKQAQYLSDKNKTQKTFTTLHPTSECLLLCILLVGQSCSAQDQRISFSPTQALQLLKEFQEGNSTARMGPDFILINDSTLVRWKKRKMTHSSCCQEQRTLHLTQENAHFTTHRLQLFQQVKHHPDISDNGVVLAKPQLLWVGP